MVSLAITIFIVAHLTVSSSKPRALPKGLTAFLERMGIPLEDFLRNQQAYRAQQARVSYDEKTRSRVSSKDLTTRFQATRVSTMSDETTRSQVSSDVPEHSGGVITNQLNNVIYMPDDAHCAPRATTIKIPKIFGVSNFPSYIILHRCTGSCPLQDGQHCTVTQQDAINTFITEITGNVPDFKKMTVYNHTGCACDCSTTASHCDPNIQRYNGNLCKCECLQDGSQKCDSATQNLNENTCECECNMAPQHCDDHNKEWDTKICGCHCKQSLQDNCKAQSKTIDTNTCQCVDKGVNAL